MKKKVCLSFALLFGLFVYVAYANTVTGEAPRGVSRRGAPIGERPLLVVPPLEEAKLSDSGEKDFGSYLVRTSLYRKENGKFVLMRREDSAFSQQQSRGGASNENWKRMKFDDYVAARPGLSGYERMTVTEEGYVAMRDAECKYLVDGKMKEQCHEFRKNRRTEWLDGLIQKNDTGDTVTEDVVSLRGGTYDIAVAPLEPVEKPGVRHPELAPDPCRHI